MRKKIRGITVTGDAIAACVPSNILPSTARFHHAWFDYERGVFVCMFEDESFDEVPEGCKFPIDVDGVSQTTWHYVNKQGDPITGAEYAAEVATP